MTTDVPRAARIWIAAAALLAAVSFAGFALVLVPRAAARPSGGFATYHTAARLLHDGEPAARFYDDAWFRARVEALMPGSSEIYFVNPPTTTLFFAPLAGLAPAAARGFFVVLGAIALVASLTLLGRELHAAPFVFLVFAVFAFVSQPVRVNLREAQVYAVVLLVLVVAWQAYRQGRDIVAGIAIGLLLVFKLAVLPIWLVPLAARRWRVLVAGVATVALFVAASWPLLGTDTWVAFFEYAARLSRAPVLAVTAHQSNTSLLRQLFSFDATFNPHPLLDAPLLAAALTVAAALTLAGAIVWLARRGRTGDLAFAAATAAGLAVVPVSQSYSYVLALFPAAVLLFRGVSDRLALWSVAAALALIGIWFRPAPPDAGALLTLLSYPKLAAAWILVAAAVRESRKEPPAAAATG